MALLVLRLAEPRAGQAETVATSRANEWNTKRATRVSKGVILTRIRP